MQIRPVKASDIDSLTEIDGTIESAEYLHLERTGDGLAIGWRLEKRPLREKLIAPNRISEPARFLAKHIADGIDEGVGLIAEAEGAPVALLLARMDRDYQAMRIVELRVDFDHRRQGLATAMLYLLISETRTAGLRAVAGETRTNNMPASEMLGKCGFELAGVDTARYTNYDLVKESATLLWYSALD